MKRQAKDMVTAYIQAAQVVIKSQGKIIDEPRRPKIPNGAQIMNVSYAGIINDVTVIIKMEGIVERIRINDKPQKDQKNSCFKRRWLNQRGQGHYGLG